jgi:hypothetical protein
VAWFAIVAGKFMSLEEGQSKVSQITTNTLTTLNVLGVGKPSSCNLNAIQKGRGAE